MTASTTTETPLPPPVPSTADAKAAALTDLLRSFGSVCIGYSGGVDSAYLAKAALDTLGADRVLAVTGLSPAYPAVQREAARSFAQQYGVPHMEIETDELADPHYSANPTNRCFYCKSELWSKLALVAGQRGLAVIVDGSNADDAGDHRPGMRAAAEAGVRSPLLEVGLSKNEIRALSRAAGLPTHDRPASPCLSSRLPYGVVVTTDRLAQVEAGESGLRALGFREFRVRHHGDAARLEFARPELAAALESRRDVVTALNNAGFEHVLLDVDGYRSGALNEGSSDLVRLAMKADAKHAAGFLRTAGISFGDVSIAGQQSDIAVISPGGRAHDWDDVGRAAVADVASAIRALGFRYVALELNPRSEP